MTAYPMVGLVLLVDGLAAYRLTRLVTADTITRALRRRVYRATYPPGATDDWQGDLDAMVDADMADHTAPKLAELVRCRWCAGIWLSAAVVGARCAAPDVWAPAAVGLAVSAVAVLLAGLEAD